MGNIQTIDSQTIEPISFFDRFMMGHSDLLKQLYMAFADYNAKVLESNNIIEETKIIEIGNEYKEISKEIDTENKSFRVFFQTHKKKVLKERNNICTRFGIDLTHATREDIYSYINLFPDGLFKTIMEREMELNKKVDKVDELLRKIAELKRIYNIDDLIEKVEKAQSYYNSLFNGCIKLFIKKVDIYSYQSDLIPPTPKKCFADYFDTLTVSYDCFLDALVETFNYAGFYCCELIKIIHKKMEAETEYNKRKQEKDEIARQTNRTREKRNKLLCHLLKKAEKYKTVYAGLDDCLANCPAFADNKTILDRLNKEVFESETKEKESQASFSEFEQTLNNNIRGIDEYVQTIQEILKDHSYNINGDLKTEA